MNLRDTFYDDDRVTDELVDRYYAHDPAGGCTLMPACSHGAQSASTHTNTSAASGSQLSCCGARANIWLPVEIGELVRW